MAIIHIDDAELVALIRDHLAQLLKEFDQSPMKQSIDQLDPVLDVKDVASYLKVSEYTVKNRLRSGELRGYKYGGYWRIKREWLLEYEQRLVFGEG